MVSPATLSSDTAEDVDIAILDWCFEGVEGHDGRLLWKALIRVTRASELNIKRETTPLIKRRLCSQISTADRACADVRFVRPSPPSSAAGDKRAASGDKYIEYSATPLYHNATGFHRCGYCCAFFTLLIKPISSLC